MGTKQLIEEYTYEVIRRITHLGHLALRHDKSKDKNTKENGRKKKENTEDNDPEFPQGEIITEFLADMLHAYGRSALIFQGGASFGLCHLGVAKALWEAGLLPDVLCGSYIGALAAAAIGILDEDELEALFVDPGPGHSYDLSAFALHSGTWSGWRRKIWRLIRHGHLFDISVVEAATRSNFGDFTFGEAHMHSGGRILNIIVQLPTRGLHPGQPRGDSTTPYLLNYLTAPDVLVWSAACASCANTTIYGTCSILMKDPGNGVIRTWDPMHTSGHTLTPAPAAMTSNLSSLTLTDYNATAVTVGSPGTPYPTAATAEPASVAKSTVIGEVALHRLSELFNVTNFIVSQVPSYFSVQAVDSATAWASHIHDAQQHDSGTASSSWLVFPSKFLLRCLHPSTLLRCLARWVMSEVEHRLQQAAHLGLIPSWLNSVRSFLGTPPIGDVRITPVIHFADIGHILQNPNPEFIQYCVEKGQRAVWCQLTHLEVRCSIEFALQRVLERLSCHSTALHKSALKSSNYALNSSALKPVQSNLNSSPTCSPTTPSPSQTQSVIRDKEKGNMPEQLENIQYHRLTRSSSQELRFCVAIREDEEAKKTEETESDTMVKEEPDSDLESDEESDLVLTGIDYRHTRRLPQYSQRKKKHRARPESSYLAPHRRVTML